MHALQKRVAQLVIAPLLGGLLSAAPLQAAPSPSQVVLVELFTSEGCSSCPPADALLRQINGTQTSAGQWIVGISEHVTYWNHLGWSDPYSSEMYTTRQNAYSERFRLDSVYTPQMIINGSEQIVGGDRYQLQHALQEESHRPQLALRIVSTEQEKGLLKITFSADGPVSREGAEIMAVLTDDADSSSVLRGENSGRQLVHVSVARAMAQVATLHGAISEKTVELRLPAGFAKTHHGGHHLVLFAQTVSLGAVVGVDTKPI